MTGAAVVAGLRGVVLTRDGWPVPGAAVTALDAGGQQRGRATAGPDGAFVLEAPAGPTTLLVAAPGHDPQVRQVGVPAGGVHDAGAVHLQRSGVGDVPPTGTWTIDAAHSSVTATARHLGLSAIHGRLGGVSGAVVVAEPFEASSVLVRLDAASVDTGDARRDAHVRAADFLDVATHPEITYRGSGLVRTSPDRWRVDGELVLLGRARPVALDVTYTGTGDDPWGGRRTAFHADAVLDRDAFAMNWNQAVGVGVSVFGTTLRVAIDVEAVLEVAGPGAPGA